MVFARALRVLSLVAATTASAQEPQTSPSPTPTPAPTPPPEAAAKPTIDGVSPGGAIPVPSPTPAVTPTLAPVPAATPVPPPLVSVDEPPLAPDELRIRANRQGASEGRAHYEGFVDLRFEKLRIQADVLDIIDEPKADGGSSQRIEANGNVVFMSGEERISGDSLRLDLDTGKGLFTKASGYLQPDVLFEAETIERVDSDTYRLTGARFTACTQTNPRWMFRAKSATVDIDKKITATFVGLRIKGVPTPLMIPYFQFPITPDQRATGFLIPRYGSSNLKGRELGFGFFWVMGRSLDQTFSYDWYFDQSRVPPGQTQYGVGFGHELRFIRDGGSRGTFRSHFTRPKDATTFAYDLDWAASQALPHRFKATLSANFYSDLTLRQDLQDSLDYSSTRTRRAAIGVQGTVGPAYVKLEADTSDVFFFDNSVQRRRHIPQLKIAQSPQKIARTGVAFGFEATAERLSQGNDQTLQTYSRMDVAPELTRSFSVPFLQVTPRALLRYTRYSASTDDAGGISGPPLDRRFFEGSVDLRGPKLFRIFSLPGNLYADKFKHTIEPELFYTYRSKVVGFDQIPSFDYGDQYPGTNQILYGLTQRVYAKLLDPSGTPVTHELLNVRVSQTYYVNADEDQVQYDFNYVSGFFSKGSHYSPLQTRVQLRPTRDSQISFTAEYNPTFRQIPNLSLSARVNRPRAILQAGWSRFAQVAEKGVERAILFDTLRGSGRFTLWPNRLTVEGSVTYDLIQKLMLQSTGKMRYGIQCCGFSVERVNYNTRYRTESKTTFSIDLGGIGSVGNFLGDNTSGQNNAGRK